VDFPAVVAVMNQGKAFAVDLSFNLLLFVFLNRGTIPQLCEALADNSSFLSNCCNLTLF